MEVLCTKEKFGGLFLNEFYLQKDWVFEIRYETPYGVPYGVPTGNHSRIRGTDRCFGVLNENEEKNLTQIFNIMICTLFI